MAYGFIHTQEADDTDMWVSGLNQLPAKEPTILWSASSNLAMSATSKPTTEIGRMFPAAYKSETRKAQCALKKVLGG